MVAHGGGAEATAHAQLTAHMQATHNSRDAEYEVLQAEAMKRFKAGNYSAAEALFRRALDACPSDDPQEAVVCNNLAATVEKRGMPREAEALYVRAIAICEERLPPDHPRVKHIRTKLATLREALFSFPGLPQGQVQASGQAAGQYDHVAE